MSSMAYVHENVESLKLSILDKIDTMSQSMSELRYVVNSTLNQAYNAGYREGKKEVKNKGLDVKELENYIAFPEIINSSMKMKKSIVEMVRETGCFACALNKGIFVTESEDSLLSFIATVKEGRVFYAGALIEICEE